MAGDVLGWISEISSTLGLWTIVAIITFLIICGRRIYYVCHLCERRREARGIIQSIQDEIRSLRDGDPNIDRAISQALHHSILDRERRLGTLSQTEDSVWIRFSACFRVDPCLRLLKGLEGDLRQKVQRMTEVRETHLRFLDACNVHQTDAALPTADLSSPQTFDAGATRQPAESASRAFSSGHSTTIEPIGTHTGYLRRRTTSPPAVTSTEDARQLMEEYIKSSTWYQADMMEPSVGDAGVPTCALLLARSGESVYRCFVDTREDQDGKTEHCCSACGFNSDRLDRLIEHQRSKRSHRPSTLRDELQELDRITEESDRLGDDSHEPNAEDVESTQLAEKDGTCGQTLFAVFVKK